MEAKMATEQQIPVIAARLVEYQKEFSKLPSEDAQWLMNHTKEAISIFVNAVINRAEPVVQIITNLLSCFFSTFTVPATTEKFVAKDKFKVDVGEKAKVKIAYLGDNFKDWFLGKIEDPFIGSIIYGRRLGKDSVDGPILEKLGGNEAAEITLTEIYAAMEARPNDESGSLRNDRANIFM
ncbi:MAG: hypothetical protein WC863_02670 [Patescibacteria group bacterium]